MILNVLGILLLASVAQASDVKVLTDSNFDVEIKDEPVILVEFYAPWCGHCKRLAPEYEVAATKLKNNDPPVPLAKVDCTVEKSTCEKYGVSGYPTLKVFKNGAFSMEYGGGRDADGIVKYMRGKAGPTSKELKSLADFEQFIEKSMEPVVVGFFKKDGNDVHEAFKKVADGLSEDFRFAHSFDKKVLKENGQSDAVLIYQPKILHNKFEEKQKKYDGSAESGELRTWVEKNIMGLAGVRTSSNMKYYNEKPLVMAYYKVDYIKNPKGTNYWRNRVMKVGKEVLKSSGKRCQFAVSNVDEMSDVQEYGITPEGDKVVIVARDEKDRKFVMKDDFNMPNFKKWLSSFLDGKEEPYLKSEAVPASNSDPVKVVVAKNFDEIVNDPSKDVLIEFYAPWCGHCKSLAPKYDELAEKLSVEKDIVIAKMDATANDVPSNYEVQGFPTLYFAPKNGKSSPLKYEGGREVKDFLSYLAKSSTDGLKNFDKSGEPKKTEL